MNTPTVVADRDCKQNDTCVLDAATSYPHPVTPLELSEEEQIMLIEEKFLDIMEILGLDITDNSLADTPRRVAKMYVKELFYGLKKENFPSLTFIEERCTDGNTIIISDISVISLCEHHFLPITGIAHVAYIPNGKIVGLSKINRIVSYFCHRPQLQERLTAQISHCLAQVLETDDVAVMIKATHSCITIRGIEDTNSQTTTTNFKGQFSYENNPF